LRDGKWVKIRQHSGPTFGSKATGGGTFGHFDAVVMRCLGRTEPQFYSELEMLQAGEDGRKVLFLDRFRFECQVDERPPEPYCWRWGYSPAAYSMFTVRDLDRFGKSIRAIDRGLQRLEGGGVAYRRELNVYR